MAFATAANLPTVTEAQRPGGGGGGGGGGIAAGPEGEPPAKRARTETPLIAALQRALDATEFGSFKARIQSILVSRIRAHPLFEFAVRFAGASGRGGHIDPLTLFDTMEGQKLIDALVTLTQSKNHLLKLRAEVAIALPRISQEEIQRRFSQTAAAQQQQQQQHVTVQGTNRADVQQRLALLDEQLRSTMASATMYEERQRALRQRIDSGPMKTLATWWKPMNARLSARSDEADKIQRFADALSTPLSTKEIKDIITAQQFGRAVADAKTDALLVACAAYMEEKKPLIPPPGGPDAQVADYRAETRMLVVRAFIKAFLTDVLCDIPMGAQSDDTWIRSAPIFSSINYALFTYLLSIPWRQTTANNNKELMKKLMAYSTMFQLLLTKNPLGTADPLGYFFDVPAGLAPVRGRSARGAAAGGSGGGGGGGGGGKDPLNAGASPSTDSERSTPTKASGTDKVSSDAPLFRSTVAPGTAPVPYLQSIHTNTPDTAMLFTWLNTIRVYGKSEDWNLDERPADTAMYGMCLQEALINVRAKGIIKLLRIFLDEFETRAKQDAFIENVLKRIGHLIDNVSAFTSKNNPATRNLRRTETVLNPAFQAQLLGAVTHSTSSLSPLIALEPSTQGNLDVFLKSLVADQYQWIDSMSNIVKDEGATATLENNAAFKPAAILRLLPDASVAVDETVLDRPLTIPPPAWFWAANAELNGHLSAAGGDGGVSTHVTNVLPELREYWLRHVTAANTNGTQRGWIDDLLNATNESQQMLVSDLTHTNTAINEINTRLRGARAEMEQLDRQRASPSPPRHGGGGTSSGEDESGSSLILGMQSSPYMAAEFTESERLRAVDEQAKMQLEVLERQLGRGMQNLERSMNIFRERADWLQAMESAFRYLQNFSPHARRWCDAIGSAQRLGETHNVQALTEFAGLARTISNTNEGSSGSRGVYQQAIYYGHNMRRAGDYAAALLNMTPQEALGPAGGFVHENLL